jgi:hypothetical protein
MSAKTCAWCKWNCWDDENAYHICLKTDAEKETADRKQVTNDHTCASYTNRGGLYV